jgi:hypothetical protein
MSRVARPRNEPAKKRRDRKIVLRRAVRCRKFESLFFLKASTLLAVSGESVLVAQLIPRPPIVTLPFVAICHNLKATSVSAIGIISIEKGLPAG